MKYNAGATGDLRHRDDEPVTAARVADLISPPPDRHWPKWPSRAPSDLLGSQTSAQSVRVSDRLTNKRNNKQKDIAVA